MQGAIRVDIDIQRLVICGSVDQPDGTRLHKVIRYDDVLLVGRDFDVMRTNGWLYFIWVVEALDVVEVGDIKGCDMVACCDGHCIALIDVATFRVAVYP